MHTNMLSSIVFLLLAGLSALSSVHGQGGANGQVYFFGGSTVIYVVEKYKNFGDSRKIYWYDPKSGTTGVLMSSDHGLLDVKSSPKGNLIAAIQYGVKTRNAGSEQDGTPLYYPVNSLIVVDTNGTVLFEIGEDVRLYDWNPDGTHIVYTTGLYREGGIGFRPTGTYIFDLLTSATDKINDGSTELKWAEFDGMIYTRGNGKDWSKIYQYDPISRKEVKTDYYGIHFSPDGEYYFLLDSEARGFRLYERHSNNEITESVKTTLARPEHDIDAHGYWHPGKVRWVAGSKLLFSKTDRNVIYHVKEATLTAEFTGTVLATSAYHAVILHDETIRVQSFHEQD